MQIATPIRDGNLDFRASHDERDGRPVLETRGSTQNTVVGSRLLGISHIEPIES